MIKRGQLYYADLSPVIGSEQGGIRPVLILQNDVGNKFSPTVIAAATTSKLNKAKLPTHISLEKEKYCLPKDSIVLLEQIRTIDKSRLLDYIGELPTEIMNKVNTALMVSLGFFANGTLNAQENQGAEICSPFFILNISILILILSLQKQLHNCHREKLK